MEKRYFERCTCNKSVCRTRALILFDIKTGKEFMLIVCKEVINDYVHDEMIRSESELNKYSYGVRFVFAKILSEYFRETIFNYGSGSMICRSYKLFNRDVSYLVHEKSNCFVKINIMDAIDLYLNGNYRMRKSIIDLLFEWVGGINENRCQSAYKSLVNKIKKINLYSETDLTELFIEILTLKTKKL